MARRWARATVAIALVGALVCAVGCGDMIDLDRKALVVGVGLDAGASPGTVQVTLQYLNPSSGGGGGGGGSPTGGTLTGTNATPVTLTATGVNVADAIAKLRDETDRFLYFGNLGVIVIGQALARTGAAAPLDFFVRDGEISESTELAVAQGTASSLLKSSTPSEMNGVALPLFELLSRAERLSYPTSPNVLWRFLGAADGIGRGSYAPVIARSPQGAPFAITGMALFRGDALAGELPGYRAEVADWLVKRTGFPDAVVRLSGERTPSSLRITQRQLKIQVLRPGEVALALSFDTTIRESAGLVTDNRPLGPLEQAAAAQMQAQIREVLDVLQTNGTDVLGISDRVLARYPSLAQNPWPSLFQKLKIDLTVAVHIYEGGRQT
jgi:spore germination protein KC